ncbi:MAG: methyltransferase domain-containing protein, partial [Gemmatimonadota bacterium]|nr:methyltransferase domain-containing protein [Gemmatimonadota bacterium]
SPYLTRARRVLELCREHHLLRDGGNVLEIGTGWVHWEATVLRLFYDVNATLIDVWDNRQFSAYKHYLAQLGRYIDSDLGVSRVQSRRARSELARLLRAQSFDEAYELLGFQYVVDEEGALQCLADESFDFIVSCAVLEHVKLGILPTFMKNMARVLKPGGYSFHTIDIGDHLAYLDSSSHQKQYLAYSERVWKSLFENQVQYFNRVQRSEWIALFEDNRLELMSFDEASTTLTGLRIAPQFQRFSASDLACTSLRVIHEKAAIDV